MDAEVRGVVELLLDSQLGSVIISAAVPTMLKNAAFGCQPRQRTGNMGTDGHGEGYEVSYRSLLPAGQVHTNNNHGASREDGQKTIEDDSRLSSFSSNRLLLLSDTPGLLCL